MKEIVIVGAGGFGRELLQWIKDINKVENKWIIKGFIDDNLTALNGYDCDYNVIGAVKDWQPSKNEVYACAIANPQIKEKVALGLKVRGAVFTSVIHPKASLGSYNKIGEGLVMYPGARINVNTKIGDYVTLLSSGIGHDVNIGDYSTISSYCGVNGHVQIGSRVFIGGNAVIIPSKKIGDDAYVGAGSVVVSNVKAGTKVFGNPAKRLTI